MNRTLKKRALLLSCFTVGYNVAEGVVSILAGLLADSIALTGFGLDSFVESLSGGVMIWRFTREETAKEEQEKVEKRAVKMVAYTFFILGAYILYESAKRLYLRETPEPTLLGIIIAAVSLIVMTILFYMKYQTGKSLNSRSLIADSKQTLACVFLSAALLIGLGLNYLYGIWQADSIIGLVIAILLIKEGYTTLKKERLCC